MRFDISNRLRRQGKKLRRQVKAKAVRDSLQGLKLKGRVVLGHLNGHSFGDHAVLILTCPPDSRQIHAAKICLL
jgi:hypothetical protein